MPAANAVWFMGTSATDVERHGSLEARVVGTNWAL
jgi:hypothetical protein